MKKTACLMVMAAVAASATLPAGAAEIAFTGADASAPTDLSSPGNWDGGALPGSGDVGVVDVAAHGTSYTLAADAQLGGLVVTNGTSMPTIQSTHVLTLGAGGLTLTGTGGIYLKAPMGIACDQTWTCGTGPLRTYNPFTGTATLTITKAKGVGHHKAPRYGGKIVYSSISEWNNSGWSRPMQINFYECAPWANTVEMPASLQIRLLFPGETSFSSLFPGIASPADLPRLNLAIEYIRADESASGVAGYPNFSLFSGETATMSAFHVGGGSVNHPAGATMKITGEVVVGNDRYYNYDYIYPCHYYLQGGSLIVGDFLELGAYGRGATRFVHADGDVTVTNRLIIGGGNQGRCEDLAEYRLEKGRLTVVAASADRNGNGMDIYRPQGQMGWGSGMYEQYGGTASVSRVMFGENDWGTATPGTANSVPKRCNDAYGLFELNAGRFILGKGGFTVGRLWNWDRAQYNIGGTNACYDARLLGGTLAASANSASTIALQLPHADGSLEWDTGAYTNVIAAPVFGEGTLRKTGTGTLALTDATAFKGSVEVEEGTVRLLGSGATGGGDYWQWTADSAAAAGIEDGGTVSNWYDSVHGVLATNVIFRGWNSGKEVVSSYSRPTLVLNKFNGHAGLRFANSLLSVPADVNPLANVEKATIVIVLSPAFDGGGDPSNQNTIYYSNYHLIGGGNGYYHGDYVPWFMFSSGNRVAMTMTCKVNGRYVEPPYPYVRSPAGRDLKNSTHVLIGTMDKGKFSLMTDGAMSCTNVAPAETETVSRYFVNSEGKPLPLHFGAMMSDGGNFRTCSQMFLAEVRVYPERVLTVGEQGSLTCELLAKYVDSTSAVKSLVDLPGNLDGEMVAPVPEVVEDVPAPTDRWTADSLAATLSDGSPVTSWTASSGSATATQPSGAGAPTFASSAFGTHAGVRFEVARSTALAAPFSGLTKQNANNWAYGVVFRSRLASIGRSGADVGRGVVACTAGSASNSDFSLAVSTNGMLVVRTAGDNIAFQRPLHLDDGRPHVAVLSCDRSGTNKAYLMVDGMLNIFNLARNPALANTDSFKLFFGRRAGAGYFEGDIAEFAWFGGGEPLTPAQMMALSKDLAQKYGARLYDRDAYHLSDIASYGLGATNVSVAAGASLSLPLANASPYTVSAGTTLTLYGSVTEGTLALADGATLKMRYGNSPISSIAALRATGNVRLVISDLPQSRPSWIPLASVEGEANIDGARWTVEGLRAAEVSVVEGVLGVFSRNGTIVIFR